MNFGSAGGAQSCLGHFFSIHRFRNRPVGILTPRCTTKNTVNTRISSVTKMTSSQTFTLARRIADTPYPRAGAGARAPAPRFNRPHRSRTCTTIAIAGVPAPSPWLDIATGRRRLCRGSRDLDHTIGVAVAACQRDGNGATRSRERSPRVRSRRSVLRPQAGG